jgi:undecaprenyl pyrophosphate phosphatase UppP
MEKEEKPVNKLTFVVTTAVTITLCAVVICMACTLMIGLFFTEVDNTEIFKMITPAFQTIIGGFIGLLAGIKLKSEDESKKPVSFESVIFYIQSLERKIDQQALNKTPATKK